MSVTLTVDSNKIFGWMQQLPIQSISSMKFRPNTMSWETNYNLRNAIRSSSQES